MSGLALAPSIGAQAEQLAASYLLAEGLSVVERNFRCRLGEIDLIMRERDCLIFVEVKYRQNKRFGGALAAITYTKQQKLRRTAAYYLQKQALSDTLSCRFDALIIEGTFIQPQYQWIKNILS